MPRTLTDLNTDVLECICQAVYDAQTTTGGSGLLKTFSTSSRSVRAAAVPVLYRNVSVTDKRLPECTAIMRAVQDASTLTRYVR